MPASVAGRVLFRSDRRVIRYGRSPDGAHVPQIGRSGRRVPAGSATPSVSVLRGRIGCRLDPYSMILATGCPSDSSTRTLRPGRATRNVNESRYRVGHPVRARIGPGQRRRSFQLFAARSRRSLTASSPNRLQPGFGDPFAFLPQTVTPPSSSRRSPSLFSDATSVPQRRGHRELPADRATQRSERNQRRHCHPTARHSTQRPPGQHGVLVETTFGPQPSTGTRRR